MSTLGQPRQFERATDTSAWGLPSDVLLLRSEPALSASSSHSLTERRIADFDRKLKSIDVIDMLSDLFLLRGVPEHIRSDNDSEFVAKAVQERISAVGATTAYIRPPLRAHSTSAKLRLARMIG